MYTQEALHRAIAEWLMCAPPAPNRTRTAQAQQGAVVKSIAEHLASVRPTPDASQPINPQVVVGRLWLLRHAS